MPIEGDESRQDGIIGTYGEYPIKYSRDIGVFILFLFTIFTASAQDEGKEDAMPYKELKKHISAECRRLHKVEDIDVLSLQMYNNLDNDCLFIIRTSVLEGVWGLPVLDFLRKNIKRLKFHLYLDLMS